MIVGGAEAAAAASLRSPELEEAPNTAPTPDFGDPVPGSSAPDAADEGEGDSSTSEAAPDAPLLTPSDEITVATPSEGGDGTETKAPATDAASSSEPSVVTGAWQAVDGQPLEVAAAGDSPAESLGVRVVDAAEVDGVAASSIVIELSRSDGDSAEAPAAIRVSRESLAAEYGADFEQRLQWTQISAEAGDGSVVRVASVTTADHVVLTPLVSAGSTFLVAAAAATAGDGTGSYSATPLKSSSTWDVAEQTGGFAWNYGMAVPVPEVGPAPEIGLSYNSQSVDGLTGSTNNQPSVVGEGWELTASGFIERTYVPCAVDDGASGAVTTSGDLCWKTDNATVSMAGHSGTLVRDSGSGKWRLANDDGTRFERLQGAAEGCADNGTASVECWRMTTTDGTQYFFGLNRLPGWTTGKPVTNSTWTVPVFGNDAGEPCHASTFAASSCMQAWRWNLDYVVDVHGNARAHYYTAESNKYARNGSGAAAYVRGGVLSRIEYGLRSNNLFGTNAAAYKALFSYDAKGRCSDAAGTTCTTQTLEGASQPSTPASYPDVPWDQLCTATACASTQKAPTFFTNARLSKVEAQVLVDSAYATVDSWALNHSYPAPGDGTKAALWLTQVQHTGSRAGQAPITEPPTQFSGTTLQNRVWTVDGLVPLDKWRLSSIKDSLGAVTSINYAPAQCTPADAPSILASPQSNTKWCYPQWWVPQTETPMPARLDLFHKYRVASVNVNAVTGPALSQATRIDYVYGTPRWRYSESPLTPANRRTWNAFAGVDTMEVREGDPAAPSAQKVTKYWYYQGMNGDRANAAGGTRTATVTGTSIPDERWFAGQLHRQQVLLGVGGSVVTDTTSTPWASGVTASDGVLSARLVRVSRTVTSEPLSTGGTRTLDTQTQFDSTWGYPTQQSVVPSDAQSKCVVTSYTAPNTNAWIVGVPSENRSVARACSALGDAQMPQDLISHERMAYDGQSWGAAPTRALPTSKEAVDRYDNGQPHWISVNASTYDALGRPLATTDGLGRTNATVYTPATSLPTASSATSNAAPFSWTTTTTYEPTTGTPTSVTDPNGATTSMTVDALGRSASVWLPLRPKAANPTSPSINHEYTLSQTAPNAVKTTTYRAGNNVVEFALFDGLGRPVQTQSSASSGGTVVKTTAYDVAGHAYIIDNPYWTTSVNPSVSLFVPDSQNAIPSQRITDFDAIGRSTRERTIGLGQEHSVSLHTYSGADRTDNDPPNGETPTTVFTNSLGQKTKLTQYLSDSVSGASQSTTYGYDPAGNLTSMTDPAGNGWSWTYDLRGHRVAQNDPDAGESTATYDNVGNITTTTDARGQLITNVYDSLNRKTATYSGDTQGALLAAWTFDTVKKGLVTSSSVYDGSVPGTPGAEYKTAVVSYDAAGNITRSTVSVSANAPAFAGTTYTTTAGYYPDSTVSVRTLPAIGGLPTEQILYSYDAWGRLSGVRGAGGILNNTIYTPIGQLSQLNRLNLGAEAYSTYGYDSVTGAMLSIKDNAVFGGAGHYVADRNYTRDTAGNIIAVSIASVVPTANTQRYCYSYDPLKQLKAVWSPGGSTACSVAPTVSNLSGPAPVWNEYDYDNLTGNRTMVTSRAAGAATKTAMYAYPSAGAAQPHALSSITGAAALGAGDYATDAAGNVIGAPGRTMTYNPLGKLDTVSSTTDTQRSIYDTSGTLLLRISTSEGATLYLGDTVLARQPGGTTVSATRTYRGPHDVPLAQRTASTAVTGSVVSWLFSDINGSVDTRTVAATGATTRQLRDPFGNGLGGSSGVWADGNGFLNKPSSVASGFVTLGARVYDSVTGKFLSVDPITDPNNPQQNVGYAYARNNPITSADPSGLAADDCGRSKANCGRPKPLSVVPGTAKSYDLGDKLISSGKEKLASIPQRLWLTVTPDQIARDTSDRIAAYSSMNLGRILKSQQGALLYGWAQGTLRSPIVFGAGSVITQGVKHSEPVRDDVERVRDSLSQGGTIPPLIGYVAGRAGFDNPNTVRDGLSVLTWQTSSNVDRTLAVLGSFSLKGEIDSLTSNSAVVTFTAVNVMSLGSGISFTDELRELGNNFSGETGPVSDVRQEFTWQETIRW